MTDEKPFRGLRDRALLPDSPYEAPLSATPPESSPATERFGLVGRSPLLHRVRQDIARYAPRTAPVVIRGETGTGKELVARALHVASPRARRPFVTTNAATFHPHLLAAELFGHERGAFTGAVTRHRGLFEQAHEGTLFLDELGELGLGAQAQLLRVLETGEVRSLGTERARTVDVRLVVATHGDLASMVREGSFREDLYYRLHVLALDLPPLRRHVEDLPLLAEHLLSRMRSEVGEKTLAPEALPFLSTYGWPGNVRQLVNVLRRAAIQSDTSMIDDVQVREALAAEPVAHVQLAEGALAATIEGFLRAEGGKLAPTARRLGIARSTLRAKIKRFNITLEPGV